MRGGNVVIGIWRYTSEVHVNIHGADDRLPTFSVNGSFLVTLYPPWNDLFVGKITYFD